MEEFYLIAARWQPSDCH